MLLGLGRGRRRDDGEPERAGGAGGFGFGTSAGRIFGGALFLLGGGSSGLGRRRFGRGEIVVGEIVEDTFVGAVLFVDLEDARVLLVAGGKNLRWFAFEENTGVGPVAVDHAADNNHGRRKARCGELARAVR